MTSQKEDIIKKQLLKKTKKLAELEKKLDFDTSTTQDTEFKISRKIYACFDGFIILRTFSKDFEEPFLHLSTNQRINIFKKNIPIRATNGQVYSLYELLKQTIGLEIRLGSKINIGSNGGGITIGDSIKIDGFQILIYSYSEMTEIAETLDDLKFTLEASEEINKLKYENHLLKNTVDELNKRKKTQIITEGKTDWKHFLTALKFYHHRNQFKNIKEDWFLRYGSGEDISQENCGTNFELLNSVSNLNKILESFINSRNVDSLETKSTIIGIFDSDDSKAKVFNDSVNKVRSFLIEPDKISTELLYSETEIKTPINKRRLYIGSEFDPKSKQLTSNRLINLGGDNNTLNKAGKNVIIDSGVYNQSGENIALTKELFAQNIFNNKIKVDEKSWERFEHIFERISELINES